MFKIIRTSRILRNYKQKSEKKSNKNIVATNLNLLAEQVTNDGKKLNPSSFLEEIRQKTSTEIITNLQEKREIAKSRLVEEQNDHEEIRK